MANSRVGQSATLLPNGQVLMAGGSTSAAAEVYNPATGKFTATGSMLTGHGTATGNLLPDGDVLVTGRATDFAELYHPATGQWSNASTGLVGLVSNPQTTAGAMLYDPATNAWTATGSMTTGRENQTATLLPDGQVLMAGGTLFDHPSVGHPGVLKILSSAELYTP